MLKTLKFVSFLVLFCLSFINLASLNPVSVEAFSNPYFEDILDDLGGYYFADEIMNLREYGVIDGYGDNTFKPYREVSREEMAKFIKNAIYGNDYYNLDCADFPDVDRSNTFYKEITTLKCEGIIDGYKDGTFGPKKTCSRGESVKFALNSLRKKYQDDNFLVKSDDEDIVSIDDIDASHTFYEFLRDAEGHTLTTSFGIDYSNGEVYDDGYDELIRPDQPILRIEMASLVWRTMQQKNLKSNLPFPKLKNQAQLNLHIHDTSDVFFSSAPFVTVGSRYYNLQDYHPSITIIPKGYITTHTQEGSFEKLVDDFISKKSNVSLFNQFEISNYTSIYLYDLDVNLGFTNDYRAVVNMDGQDIMGSAIIKILGKTESFYFLITDEALAGDQNTSMAKTKFDECLGKGEQMDQCWEGFLTSEEVRSKAKQQAEYIIDLFEPIS
jgi:hypothetical protein